MNINSSDYTPKTATGVVVHSNNIQNNNDQKKDFSFNPLPKDVLILILSYLDANSIIQSETIENCFSNNDFKESLWGHLKKIEHLEIKYGGAASEKNRNKCEYLITKFIIKFMLKDNYRERNDDRTLQEINKKYGLLCDRFPFLVSFFRKELNNKFFIPAFDYAFTNAYSMNDAGEKMLKGMILSRSNMTEDAKNQMILNFQQAIEENVTCFILFNDLVMDNETQLKLALQAAEKGDERSLWHMLKIGQAVDIDIEVQKSYFSTSLFKIFQLIKDKDFVQANKWVDDTLKKLSDPASKFKLPKISLKDYNIGDEFFNSASLLSGQTNDRLKKKNLELLEKLASLTLNVVVGNKTFHEFLFQLTIKEISLFNCSNNKMKDWKTNCLVNLYGFNNLDTHDSIKDFEKIFEKTIKVCGNDTPAFGYYQLAMIKNAQNMKKEAEHYLILATQKCGIQDLGYLYGQLARIKWQLNDYAGCKKYNQLAMDAYGENVPSYIYCNLADAHWKLDEYEEAALNYDAAIELKHDISADSYSYLASIKEIQHKYEDCEKFNLLAITAYGKNVPAYIYINLANAQYELSNFGDVQWKTKKLEEANINYQAAYNLDSKSLSAFACANLAQMYFDKGQFAKCESFNELSIKRYGVNVPAKVYCNLADVKWKLGKKEEAEVNYLNAINAPEGYILPTTSYGRLGMIKIEKNELGDAEKYLELAVSGAGSSGPSYIYKNLADIQFNSGKLEQAKKNYLSAINIKDDYSQPFKVYCNLAVIEFNAKNYNNCIKFYYSAIAQKESESLVTASLFANLGDAYWNFGNPLEAESNYELALAKDNTSLSGNSLSCLAAINWRKEDYNKCKEYNELAIVACGNNVPPSLYSNLADALYRLNDVEGAEKNYDKAYSMDVNSLSGMSYENLATIKYRRGQLDLSETLYNLAILKYGYQTPSYIFANLSQIKVNQGKYKESEGYFKLEKKSYGLRVPGSFFYRYANLKWVLGEYLDCDKYVKLAQKAGAQFDENFLKNLENLINKSNNAKKS